MDTAKTESTVLPIDEGIPVTLRKNAKECPTQFVIVYQDRAEITRLIEFSEAREGQQQIVVSDLPSTIHEGSVRVSGGTGSAVILEVAHEVKTDKPIAESEEEKREKQEKVDAIRLEIQKHKKEVFRLQRQLEFVEDFSKNTTKTQEKHSVISIDEAMEVMTFYHAELRKLQESIYQVNQQISKLTKEETEILKPKVETPVRTFSEISIDLHVTSAGPVALQFSYVVSGASWTPSYDVRVQGTSTKVELTYFGHIVNNTTEDWKDVRLSLSTASPDISGAPPSLTTKTIYSRAIGNYSPRSFAPSMSNALFVESKKSAESYREQQATTVETSATNSTFVIPRPTSIETDNKPHKVTVTIVILEAIFSYTTIPKLAQHAYLRAICTNTSDYPLIQGQMNVFMDNAFVTTSSLKRTNPKEELSLFIGTDSSVVVEFKDQEFKEQKGLISKSNVVNYHHSIIIKNTKSIDIEVSVFDQLPKPDGDSVKVVVLKPNLKEDKSVVLNEFNNMRWTLKVGAGTTHKIDYQYSVEWGKDKEISFYT